MNERKQAKISIIIPAYNASRTIEKCISSIREVDYDNWEAIIINDGSKDDTLTKCEKMLSDSRIKLVTIKNGGVSNARNTGIRCATGELITFVDSDDYLEKEALTIFNEHMQGADFCIASYNIVCDSERKEIAPAICGKYDRESFSSVFAYLYENGFTNSPWAKCYKKELITALFDTETSLGEDLLFNLDYLHNCKRITVIDSKVYDYVVQLGGSLSTGLLSEGFGAVKYVLKESIKHLNEMGLFNERVSTAIYTKYCLDVLNLIERNLTHNPDYKTVQDVKHTCEQYEFQEALQKCDMSSQGIKWIVIKIVIQFKAYGLYIMIVLLLTWIKQRGVK